MAEITQSQHAESAHRVDDPTSATLLADAHDRLMPVNVTLPDGSVDHRYYEVHLPNGVSDTAAQHLPVVFALDGTTANKPYTGMAVDNKINAEADRDNFIAVYPMPKPRSVGLTVAGLDTGIAAKTVRDWNAPGVGSLPTDPHYNDVDYMKSVIADVQQKFSSEPGQVDAVGMSLGGEFLMDLNNKLPKGTFNKEYMVSSTEFGTEGVPTGAAGASVKVVRGDSDPILPEYGAMHQDFPFLKNMVMRGVEATSRTDNNCPPCVVNSLLDVNGYKGPAQAPVGHGTYSEITYQTPTGAKIVVDTVFGAGHFWFGRETGGSHETIATDSNGVNPPASAFDATRDMAKFFGLAKD